MKNLLIMHVYPSSPNSSISEDNAARKIQANFRGYRVRKQIKDTSITSTSTSTVCSSSSAGVVGTSSGAASMADTTGGCCKRGSCAAAEDGGADRQLDHQSATKIQAGIRGYLVRKKQKVASEAATKIQANFRGFKTRRELKQKPCDH